MYGLGLAEAELASFLRRRRADVTVTTKFGIDPTLLARGAARVQAPLRAFVATRPHLQGGLRSAGQGPRSGPLGSLLYSSHGYHRGAAQRSLERSLRALGTDCIDVFLLHDPAGGHLASAPELMDYLAEERRLGRIRCWGVTGQPSGLPAITQRLARAEVVQFRDDIFSGRFPPAAGSAGGRARITYGALERALPALRQFFARRPDALTTWSERLGADLAAESALPRVLLSAAIRRNEAGPVLFSTTRPERIAVAAEAAAASVSPAGAEMEALNELATAAAAGETGTS
jgi:aryl-alcohol dehydrogenase-like predicted oxidoreductase